MSDPFINSPTDRREATAAAVQEEARNRRKQRLYSVIAIASVVLICACIVILWLPFRDASRSMPEIENTLDAFFILMERGDVDRAFELFVSDGQDEEFRVSLHGMVEGANQALVDGYLLTKIDSSRVTLTPNGMVALVNGTVIYRDGHKGKVSARLVEVEGVWKLSNIDINVSPDKVQEYLEGQQ